MLAPFLLDTQDDLAATANVLRDIGGFAEACLSASVAQTDPPLESLDEVRGILSDCRAVAQSWLTARSGVLSPLSAAFLSYSASISAAVARLSAADDPATLKTFLTELRGIAGANSQSARDAQDVLALHHTRFADLHEKLDTALLRAQEELEIEEADMERLAVKLQELTDRLATYNVGWNAATMGGGKSVVQTVVKIDYDALIGGVEEVPYVSIVVMLFNVAGTIHTEVVDDAEIGRLLREIAALLVRFDEDARVVAMLRGLLQQLGRMNEAYIAASQNMPRINGYWDAEAAKIDGVIDALRAGGAPKFLTDIITLPAASTVWQQLAAAAKSMVMPVIREERQVTLHVAAHPMQLVI